MKIRWLIRSSGLACLLLLLYPGPAAAYLDPSAGNALVYIAVTAVSVVGYVLKGVFYKAAEIWTGRRHTSGAEDVHRDIVLFSEGKNYWTTFKPVVFALISRGQTFSYFTTDVEDPGLTLRNPLMKGRYLGEGSAAYARLNRVRCRVMLSTTPNIGTPGFPLPRPAGVEFLAHVFHAPAGVAYYKKGSLDAYDGVCMVGEYSRPAIRHLERLRGLPEKELVCTGLPYWDAMLERLGAGCKEVRPEAEAKQARRPTVLLAPSWGDKGFLSCYDPGFIEALAKEDFDIIFRPHPQSWRVEPALLRRLRKALSAFGNVTWDEGADPSRSLEASDVLISDTSAIRMDYAVVYGKPVISLEMDIRDRESFEVADLPSEYMDSLADRICVPVGRERIGDIVGIVREALREGSVWERENAGAYAISCFGCAGKSVADYLIKKSAELSVPERNGAGGKEEAHDVV